MKPLCFKAFGLAEYFFNQSAFSLGLYESIEISSVKFFAQSRDFFVSSDQ